MIVDLLTALAAVILLSQVLGRLFARLHQPPVIGEILAGLALGPSLLPEPWPELRRFGETASRLPAGVYK